MKMPDASAAPKATDNRRRVGVREQHSQRVEGEGHARALLIESEETLKILSARAVGVLGMMWTQPQPLDAAQLAYISAVTTLLGQALVRAQVYADEHARAAVLQAAVLPNKPADVAELTATIVSAFTTWRW